MFKLPEQRFNSLLILKVREREQLWDKAEAKKKNENATELAKSAHLWEQIGKSVSCSGLQCKNKWDNLRATYRKNLKVSLGASGPPKKVKWRHFAEMDSFLRPVLLRAQGANQWNVEQSHEIDGNHFDLEEESNVALINLANQSVQAHSTAYNGNDASSNVTEIIMQTGDHEYGEVNHAVASISAPSSTKLSTSTFSRLSSQPPQRKATQKQDNILKGSLANEPEPNQPSVSQRVNEMSPQAYWLLSLEPMFASLDFVKQLKLRSKIHETIIQFMDENPN